MIFTTLKLQNILSYSELEFNLNPSGSVLIIGKNGSGKSSIWDALAWVLFGVTLKGLKGDEVVSLFAGKNTMVSVEIEDEGKVFTIVRYRKHTECKNELHLYENGKDISEWSIERTQAQIELILGMNVKLFTNSVMFAQGNSDFFCSLTDKEQKEMLENFVDTTGWDACLEYTKAQVVELTATVDQVQREVQRKRDKVEFLGDKLEDLREKQANFENDREEEQKELTSKLKASIMSVNNINKGIERARKDLEGMTAVVNKLQTQKDKALKCDKCNQLLPFAREKELKQAKEAKEGFDRELYQYKIQLRTQESSKNNNAEDLVKLQETENAYSETIEDYEAQQIKLLKEAETAEQSIAKHQEELTMLRFWVEGFGSKGIKSFVFESLLPEFNSIVAEYIDLMTDGEIKVKLSSTSKLKSGESRERFAVHLSNESGSNTHKASSAGERRSIDLAILWTLQQIARNKLKSAISFEVLDEAADALDEAHIDAVLKVVAKHSRQRSVFAVSHNDQLKNSFDTVYQVTKHNKRSILEVV